MTGSRHGDRAGDTDAKYRAAARSESSATSRSRSQFALALGTVKCTHPRTQTRTRALPPNNRRGLFGRVTHKRPVRTGPRPPPAPILKYVHAARRGRRRSRVGVPWAAPAASALAAAVTRPRLGGMSAPAGRASAPRPRAAPPDGGRGGGGRTRPPRSRPRRRRSARA